MFGLWGWRAGAERAKSDARHLRERYGAEAEAWCAAALAALPAGDRRRKPIQKIAKALRFVPSSRPITLKPRALAGPVRREFEPRRGF